MSCQNSSHAPDKTQFTHLLVHFREWGNAWHYKASFYVLPSSHSSFLCLCHHLNVLDPLCFWVVHVCVCRCLHPKVCEHDILQSAWQNLSKFKALMHSGTKTNWLDFEVKDEGHDQTKYGQKGGDICINSFRSSSVKFVWTKMACKIVLWCHQIWLLIHHRCCLYSVFCYWNTLLYAISSLSLIPLHHSMCGH